MYGFSVLETYFLINMLYTLITFFFLHNITVEIVMKRHERLTNETPTDEQITTTMNMFYIISIFVGSIRLCSDILCLLINRKECIWLYRLYESKEDKE